MAWVGGGVWLGGDNMGREMRGIGGLHYPMGARVICYPIIGVMDILPKLLPLFGKKCKKNHSSYLSIRDKA